MGNEFRGSDLHSAERFGESRDFWWHDDYLRLRAAAWQLQRVEAVLDVGSGVGHWGRRLASVLPQTARVTGVDREPFWVEKASERASAAGLGSRFSYVVGTAEALPFEDASFDLVTCQTVLMHLPDPGSALREMVRVARPGGLVLVAEPTNVLTPALLGAISLLESADRVAAHVRLQFACQAGKRVVGEGDAQIGERLPGLLGQAGLERVEARVNDRAFSLVPPYDSPLERAMLEELRSDVERGRWIWDREETRRYFLAGNGDVSEFDALYDAAVDLRRRELEAVEAKTFVRAGGSLFYLIWGFKPS